MKKFFIEKRVNGRRVSHSPLNSKFSDYECILSCASIIASEVGDMLDADVQEKNGVYRLIKDGIELCSYSVFEGTAKKLPSINAFRTLGNAISVAFNKGYKMRYRVSDEMQFGDTATHEYCFDKKFTLDKAEILANCEDVQEAYSVLPKSPSVVGDNGFCMFEVYVNGQWKCIWSRNTDSETIFTSDCEDVL